MKKSIKAFSYEGPPWVVLFLRLLIILFVLSLSRMCLYFFNTDIFFDLSFGEVLSIFSKGLKFDVSTLFTLCSILILANCFPFKFRDNPVYQKTINSITLFIVSLAIILNLSDAIYYRFTLKRMTFDIFNYLEADTGFAQMAPRFIIDFWYIVLLEIILIALMVVLYKKLRYRRNEGHSGWRFYVRNSILFLISAFVIIVGIRGGIGKDRLRPLSIVDAGRYVPAAQTPLVLNTPFTIIKSYGQEGFQLKNDFKHDELEKLFNPIHSYQPLENVPDSINNVVVFILESFSMEHIGYFHPEKSFTPFLDSLFSKSLVFSGIANGKRSVEGVPAILSSIPTLTNKSFLMGAYAADEIEGLAKTLSKKHYRTAFFHGGKNGTMNLDAYSVASGFQEYYGLNEYPNKDDYDGFWGIWDELYLKYFDHIINDFQQPFLAALFTLSSHHPYQVPEKYENKFPSGILRIQKSIAYTDYSLREFFRKAKTQDWFKHTLFVFSADHTSEGASPAYKNSLGQFRIPIAFYAPADSLLKTRSDKFPVQQTDIFPSILQYLGITDTVLCFGSSVFDTTSYPFGINYFNQQLQIFNADYLLQSQNNNATALYKYKDDPLLQNNLIKTEDYSQLMKFQRAFVQQYNNRMIQNRLKNK